MRWYKLQLVAQAIKTNNQTKRPYSVQSQQSGGSEFYETQYNIKWFFDFLSKSSMLWMFLSFVYREKVNVIVENYFVAITTIENSIQIIV